MAIRSHVDRVTAESVSGWAFDPEHPDQAVIVVVSEGGRVLGSIEATGYRADLAAAGYRGGHCAFLFKLPSERRIADKDLTVTFRQTRSTGAAPDDGWIEFGSNPVPTLKRHGLALHALRGRQKLGAGTLFEPPLVLLAAVESGSSVQIGAFTGVYGKSLNRCSIGRYCSIAPDVVIGPNEHAMTWLTTSLAAEQPQVHDWDEFVAPGRRAFFMANAPRFRGNIGTTTIGNDVWLGNGVFVRAGVTIGDGAIVGARAVVVSDIPPYAIAVGNPARVKRMRFPDRVIERLQRLSWWRFSTYDLSGTPFDDVERALDVIETKVAAGAIAEYRPETYTPARLRELLEAG